MALLSRERMLDALIDLCGRSPGRTRSEFVAMALRCALGLSEAEAAVIVAPQGRGLERTVVRRGDPDVETSEFTGSDSPLMQSLHRSAMPITVASVADDLRVATQDRGPGLAAGPALFVPLRFRQQERGYLAVYRPPGAGGFGAEDVRLLVLLAGWTTLAMENHRLTQSVKKLAVTDDLTRVYNYRFLKSALRREIKRAARYKQDLSIIMIDVDNLKSYNDRHGHLRGSHLLREMAGLLADQVRSWDLVAKYGGDEFTIILPQTPVEGALIAADRLRTAIVEHTFPMATQGQITISAGVATFPADGDSVQSLIRAADVALYAAKKNGRNRVERGEREAA